jgi:hypothetical protein
MEAVNSTASNIAQPITCVERLPQLGHFKETFFPRGCQVYPQSWHLFLGLLGPRGKEKGLRRPIFVPREMVMRRKARHLREE